MLMVAIGVKHLNPRQGITTSASADCTSAGSSIPSVKHLNPRQGITTSSAAPRGRGRCTPRVKHLNPRQGITKRSARFCWC